jgi:hydrogenase maturation protease
VKTLVIGLGNPILSDDGVGICVVQELRKRVDLSDITIIDTHIGGIRLLELMAGYETVILIDAIQTKNGRAGKVSRLEFTDFEKTRHISSPHEINFSQIMELGKRLGMIPPEKICIIAVEAADVTTFDEHCTPEVQQAIPAAIERVLQEINAQVQTDSFENESEA